MATIPRRGVSWRAVKRSMVTHHSPFSPPLLARLLIGVRLAVWAAFLVLCVYFQAVMMLIDHQRQSELHAHAELVETRRAAYIQSLTQRGSRVDLLEKDSRSVAFFDEEGGHLATVPLDFWEPPPPPLEDWLHAQEVRADLWDASLIAYLLLLVLLLYSPRRRLIGDLLLASAVALNLAVPSPYTRPLTLMSALGFVLALLLWIPVQRARRNTSATPANHAGTLSESTLRIAGWLVCILPLAVVMALWLGSFWRSDSAAWAREDGAELRRYQANSSSGRLALGRSVISQAKGSYSSTEHQHSLAWFVYASALGGGFPHLARKGVHVSTPRTGLCDEATALRWIRTLGDPALQAWSKGGATLITGRDTVSAIVLFAPYWLVALIAAIPPGLRGLRAYRRYRARWRLSAGHCRRCGYNLTGNVSGVCSECGERI